MKEEPNWKKQNKISSDSDEPPEVSGHLVGSVSDQRRSRFSGPARPLSPENNVILLFSLHVEEVYKLLYMNCGH